MRDRSAKEVASVVDGLTGPRVPDDGDGYFEHRQADLGRGPAAAEDVFVWGFAGADAPDEPALKQQRRRGRGLGAYRQQRVLNGNVDLTVVPPEAALRST